MKKAHFILLAIPFMFILSGCPVGIAYPLAKPGSEKIDKNLIGTWTQVDTNKEVMTMQIEKLDEFTLKLTVIAKGSMFVEEVNVFKGWCKEINNQKFAYFQDYENFLADYYHYAYKFDGKNLISYDFGLLDGGIDSITSSESFQAQVKTSMTKPEFLSSEIIWSKN